MNSHNPFEGLKTCLVLDIEKQVIEAMETEAAERLRDKDPTRVMRAAPIIEDGKSDIVLEHLIAMHPLGFPYPADSYKGRNGQILTNEEVRVLFNELLEEDAAQKALVYCFAANAAYENADEEEE